MRELTEAATNQATGLDELRIVAGLNLCQCLQNAHHAVALAAARRGHQLTPGKQQIDPAAQPRAIGRERGGDADRRFEHRVVARRARRGIQ